MSATPSGRITQFPERPTPRSSVDAYLRGMEDGRRDANHNYLIGGITLGLVAASLLFVVVLASQGYL